MLALLIAAMVMPVASAVQTNDYDYTEGDVYEISSDVTIIGPPMPAPEPPVAPIAPEPILPEPPVITPPSGAPRPDDLVVPEPEPETESEPEPESEPIIIAVERVLPCPPEPPATPIAPEPILPEPPVITPPSGAPRPDDPVVLEPEPPIVGVPAPPVPMMCVNDDLTVFCEICGDDITVWTEEGVENPRLFVFDMASCQVEIMEPDNSGRYPTFRLEKPRGSLFLAVFNDDGVLFKVTL